jgi:hypothetical protein
MWAIGQAHIRTSNRVTTPFTSVGNSADSRRLEAVRCSALLGAGSGTGLRFDAPPGSPSPFLPSLDRPCVRPGGHRGYFVAAAGTGRSELKMSATTFQVPSACFFHTVTYLPRSVTGFPVGSCVVSS